MSDDLLFRVTRVVRAADGEFVRVGGSSRHWVKDCFLPLLDREGLGITPLTYAQLTQGRFDPNREREERITELAKTDPAIHWLWEKWQRGEWSWEQMLFEGVIVLQQQNEEMLNQLTKEIQNRRPRWE